jgi:hypothetical protein
MAAEGLQAGARGGHHADPAALDPVGESEPDARYHRGAAVGAHHQQVAPSRLPFERDLLLHRHVVAEQEDVAAGGERAPGDHGGMTARHRHQHPAGRRQLLQGALERPGPIVRTLRPARHQERVDTPERRLRRAGVAGGDDDQQVVGARGRQLHREEPRRGEELAVGGRGHHRRRLGHPRLGGERPLQLHQDDGVEVGAGAEEVAARRHRSSSSAAASAPQANTSSS